MNNTDISGGWANPPPEKIKELLENSKTIAVVGLSPKPDRASNGVSEYLQKQGFRIIPVNPGENEILGEKSYSDLKSIPDRVDIVDVFRRPEAAPGIVEEAIAVGAGAVWLQEGVVSEAAFEAGSRAGLIMIMDRCIFKTHRQLFGN
jgi:predicted CoA-binding protein